MAQKFVRRFSVAFKPWQFIRLASVCRLGTKRRKHSIRWQHLSLMKERLLLPVEKFFLTAKAQLAISETSAATWWSQFFKHPRGTVLETPFYALFWTLAPAVMNLLNFDSKEKLNFFIKHVSNDYKRLFSKLVIRMYRGLGWTDKLVRTHYCFAILCEVS